MLDNRLETKVLRTSDLQIEKQRNWSENGFEKNLGNQIIRFNYVLFNSLTTVNKAFWGLAKKKYFFCYCHNLRQYLVTTMYLLIIKVTMYFSTQIVDVYVLCISTTCIVKVRKSTRLGITRSVILFTSITNFPTMPLQKLSTNWAIFIIHVVAT